MKTSGTNRKLRTLFVAISNGNLILEADFQRRLVWTAKHKNALLRTVLEKYPFPEIFIVTKDSDNMTAESIEAVVDGQQRLTTLYDYFKGEIDYDLESDIKPFKDLTEIEKQEFLEYEVVIRDLGIIERAEIVEVFRRLNSTNYSLNSMEVNNALYDGEFKDACLSVADNRFFEENKVFTSSEIRRMKDVLFVANIFSTILCGYYTSDKKVEECLSQYNEIFKEKEKVVYDINSIITIIEGLNIESERFLHKADLFTLIVELYKNIVIKKIEINLILLGEKLNRFYGIVDQINIESPEENVDVIALQYKYAAQQGTNSRGNRIKRGEIISKIIEESI